MGSKLHVRVPTGAHHPGNLSISSSWPFIFSWLHSFSRLSIVKYKALLCTFPHFHRFPPFSPVPVPLPIVPNPESVAPSARRTSLSRLSGFCIIHKNFMQIIRYLIKYVLDKIFSQSCFGKKIASMTDKEQKKPSSPSNLVRVGSGLVNKLALLNPVTGESDEPILVGFEDVSAAAYRIRKGIKKTPCEVNICRKLAIILQHQG